MYFYYFLTSYSDEIKKSLWWKKHITQVQLIQFVLLFLYCVIGTFHVDCDNPRVFLIVGIVQSVVMMSMFGDFYYKAYLKKKASP
jgi:hypothetical protein